MFLALYRNEIGEFWEPGFVETSAVYHETMVALEDNAITARPADERPRALDRSDAGRPSWHRASGSGTSSRRTAPTRTTRRSRCASSSPRRASRRQQRQAAAWSPNLQSQSLLLGADAQAQAWAQAMVDFPLLKGGGARAELSKKLGPNALEADVFKVPHHASKNGLHLELVELVKPELSLVSSASGAGQHARASRTTSRSSRSARRSTRRPTTAVSRTTRDWEHGIHYTCARATTPVPICGTIAVVFHRQAKTRSDLALRRRRPGQPSTSTAARRFA